MAVGGAVAFRRLGMLDKLPAKAQPVVKTCHRAAGALVWFAALINVLLGLTEKGAGPRTTLHYCQGILIVALALAQAALLLQPRPASYEDETGVLEPPTATAACAVQARLY